MILVTGATGNVGRLLIGRLADAGAEVRAVTRHPEATGLPASVEVIKGDPAPAFVSSEVAKILGRPAHTFAEWAADHAADFQN
jgi:uncharacterized protein YbjT (DUF2867 family)